MSAFKANIEECDPGLRKLFLQLFSLFQLIIKSVGVRQPQGITSVSLVPQLLQAEFVLL